ncbi:MAG TPA: glutamine synthetase family protein [Thermoleophilia bacterium]|nr:glutamine synthetase family protein [Thermoleophilia bacterium]
MNTERQAGIEKLVKDENVKHIQLWFTDILGYLKMIEILDRQLPSVIESGAPFDGSSISGYAEVEESDIVAMPDWDTFTILPWAQGSERTAFVFCDIHNRDHMPFEGDPRWVLRRQLARAARMGFEFYVSPELEYFYFKDNVRPELTDEGGYFDVLPADLGNDLRKQTMRTLDRLGIPMEASHHEVAPSQHELDPHYDKALIMADRVMTIRMIVKEIAAHNGVHATFMPKPLHGHNGSGMHVHQSLFKGDTNAMFSPTDPGHMSELCKSFIAGQLKHMREICSLLNQYVNSYKRLVPGFEAPVYISWAHRNRTALIRVPLFIQGRESSVRAEVRNPDPAANPYLALAVLLAAGLEGIEQDYELPPSVEPNIYKLSADQRETIGLGSLPNNLYEAIKETRESELVRRTLGDHVFERFITNKLNEWYEYREQVTDWEIARYYSTI